MHAYMHAWNIHMYFRNPWPFYLHTHLCELYRTCFFSLSPSLSLSLPLSPSLSLSLSLSPSLLFFPLSLSLPLSISSLSLFHRRSVLPEPMFLGIMFASLCE